jgi:hypothetical protein
MTPNDQSSFGKSRNIGVLRTTFKCDLRRIVQWNHSTTQRVGSLVADINCLLHRQSAIEPVAIPPIHPHVPHSRGKPRPTPKATRVKSDAAKLRGEGTLGLHKFNLLILVVQLIVLNKNIYSRMVPTRSNILDKLTDLEDSIRCQLMQLHSELMQDVHKNRTWGM